MRTIILLLLTLPTLAWAQEKSTEDSQKIEEMSIQFNAPEIVRPLDGTYVKVKISGHTSKAGEFSLNVKETNLLRDKTVYSLTEKQIVPQGFENKGTDHDFQYELNLPAGIIQLGLMFKAVDGSENEYGLNFKLTKTKIEQKIDSKELEVIAAVEETAKVTLEEAPAEDSIAIDDRQKNIYKNVLSLGVGINFLKYSQNYSQPFSSDLVYESFKAPGFYGSYYHQWTDYWHSNVEIKNAVGATSTGSQTNVKEGNYQWVISNAEAIYLTKAGTLWDFYSRFPLRIGLQHHIVPFIERVAANQVSIKTNSVTYLTLGYGVDLFDKSQLWDYQAYMRFQFPIVTGSKFDINSSLSFDGSVGVNRKIARAWSLGFFWYGQYLYNEFEGARDAVTGLTTGAGNQTLFYSNLELRASYFW